MKKETVLQRMKIVVKSLDGSGYKMGDHIELTVKFNNEILKVTHDTREYYSGRQAKKYNANIKHGQIRKEMSLTELNKAYKPIIERIERIKNVQIERENKKIKKLNSNEPFDISEEKERILFHSFERISIDEITTAFNKRSKIQITAEDVEYIYKGWQSDFKTYKQIKEQWHLYAPCGHNPFSIQLFKMQGEPLTEWV